MASWHALALVLVACPCPVFKMMLDSGMVRRVVWRRVGRVLEPNILLPAAWSKLSGAHLVYQWLQLAPLEQVEGGEGKGGEWGDGGSGVFICAYGSNEDILSLTWFSSVSVRHVCVH